MRKRVPSTGRWSFAQSAQFVHGHWLDSLIQTTRPWRGNRGRASKVRLGSEADTARDLQKSRNVILVVIWPSAALPTVRLADTSPNCTRLKRLKASTRKSNVALSKVTFLNTDKSKFAMPGWRKALSVRDSLPKVKGAGAAKQARLKYVALGSGYAQAVWHGATGFFRTPGSGVRA